MTRTALLHSLTTTTTSLMAILYSLVISRSSLSVFENTVALGFVTLHVESMAKQLDDLTTTSPFLTTQDAKEATRIRNDLAAALAAIQYIKSGGGGERISERLLRSQPNTSLGILPRNSPYPRRLMGEPRNLRECPYDPE